MISRKMDYVLFVETGRRTLSTQPYDQYNSFAARLHRSLIGPVPQSLMITYLSMGVLEQRVADSALRVGFALVGFAQIHRLTNREAFFQQWIAEGRAAEM